MLQVRNIDKDQKFHKVADYDGITLKYTEPSPNFDYTFPGGSKEKPPDQATCNFKNDPCPG